MLTSKKQKQIYCESEGDWFQQKVHLRAGDLIVANLKCTDGDNNVLSHAEEMEIVVRPKLSLADAELEGFDKLVAKLNPGTDCHG